MIRQWTKKGTEPRPSKPRAEGTYRTAKQKWHTNTNLVVGVDTVLSVLVGGVPVDAAVLVAPHHAKVLKDVQHPRHLGEDQHAVPLGVQLPQQLVQENHLHAFPARTTTDTATTINNNRITREFNQ